MPLYCVSFEFDVMVAAATERDAIFEARSNVAHGPELEHAQVLVEKINSPRKLTKSQAGSYPYGGGKTCQKMAEEKMAEEAAEAIAATREKEAREAEIARVQVSLFGGDRG